MPISPVAEFSAIPISGSADLSVLFTDLSTGAPTSWLWNFGDSGSSTSQNPSHEYTDAGKKTVSLQVTQGLLSDTETKIEYISVYPVALFTGEASEGDPSIIVFRDQSIGNPTSWFWEFGDGATSTAQFPSHQYTKAGVYTVKLTISRGGLFGDIEKLGYVVIDISDLSTGIGFTRPQGPTLIFD